MGNCDGKSGADQRNGDPGQLRGRDRAGRRGPVEKFTIQRAKFKETAKAKVWVSAQKREFNAKFRSAAVSDMQGCTHLGDGLLNPPVRQWC